MDSELFSQTLRFAVVGGVVTGVFMGLNALLGLKLGKNPAFAVAYVPAVALHFALNRLWTFGQKGSPEAHQLFHYAVTGVVAFALQWGAFRLLTTRTTIKPWLASGLATAVQMVLAFVAMKLWVFAAG